MSFWEREYEFTKRYKLPKQQALQKVFDRSRALGLSSTDTLKALKTEGLGYRRKVFLKDYFAQNVFESATTSQAYENKEAFVAKVDWLMKHKKVKNRKEANEFVNKQRRKALNDSEKEWQEEMGNDGLSPTPLL